LTATGGRGTVFDALDIGDLRCLVKAIRAGTSRAGGRLTMHNIRNALIVHCQVDRSRLAFSVHESYVLPVARPPREDRGSVAEAALTIRLTTAEREMLNALVKLRQEELGAEAKVSQGSYIRALIDREAKAKGLPVLESASEPTARPKAKRSTAKR
jgi:hypothetical protein